MGIVALCALLVASGLDLYAQTSGGTVNFANNKLGAGHQWRDGRMDHDSRRGASGAVLGAGGFQYLRPDWRDAHRWGAAGGPLCGRHAYQRVATSGGTTGQFQVFAWSGGYPTYEEALQHPGDLIGSSPKLRVQTGNPAGDPPTPPASLVAYGLQYLILRTNNPPPPCLPPLWGTISWWPLEGNAEDIIGGHNGTLEGSYGFGPGEVGLGLSLSNNPAGFTVPITRRSISARMLISRLRPD